MISRIQYPEKKKQMESFGLTILGILGSQETVLILSIERIGLMDGLSFEFWEGVRGKGGSKRRREVLGGARIDVGVV